MAAHVLVVDSVFFPAGGALAVPWGRCGGTTNEEEKELYKQVESWFTERVMSDKTVHYKPRLESPYLPGITLVGDIGESDYSVTTSSANLVVKPKSSYKEFEEAKRANKIILRPLLKCKTNARGTPEISAANTAFYPRNDLAYSYYGATKPGVCKSRYWAIPSLEMDSFAGKASYVVKRFDEPYLKAVPEDSLKRAQGDIVSFLGREEPISQLVTQLVAEANSATWDLATEIGEMPETIKMVLKGVMDGVRLLLRFKRELKKKLELQKTDFRNHGRLGNESLAEEIAKLWMQYRYGIMPIVYSVNDGLDFLEMENRKFQSFRGRKDMPVESFNLPGGYILQESPTVQHRCFLKYGYDLDASVPQGLKINLASTAWELFPFSFIWDWFFQVGDFLTASFTPGVVNQIGCMYSYRVKGQYVWRNDKHSTITIDVDYYRATPIKPDSFIGINSEVFISYKRAMDALALSWLMFKKKK